MPFGTVPAATAGAAPLCAINISMNPQYWNEDVIRGLGGYFDPVASQVFDVQPLSVRPIPIKSSANAAGACPLRSGARNQSDPC